MAATSSVSLASLRPTWQQTMLRIKNPVKSLDFYTRLMGMTLVDKLSFPKYSFDLYFLQTLPEGQTYENEPGTDAAHSYLASMDGVTLELTHNYGTEDQEDFSYHVGNEARNEESGMRDGFGHIAFNTMDVYEACDRLEAESCGFKKKPNEGRMKGLAFVYDPDGYWVEIVQRPECEFTNYFNLSQTMIRVKDPVKTVAFYEALGMTNVREIHFSDFSLFFMTTLPEGVVAPDPKSDEARDFVKTLFTPVLELTHNHGTESDDTFKHYCGNEDGRKGFGHVGFLVDDVDQACEQLGKLGYGMKKGPQDGMMKGLAFAYDPDGYWVEIIKRGGYDDAGALYYLEETNEN